MGSGVVLDTSYLITLADRHRKHHHTAKRYWIYFTENEIPILLSTIVVSEFWVKQKIPEAILRTCMILPFNWDDALKTASLREGQERQKDESRDALKDDIKILGQAIVKEATYVITDDSKTFYRYGKHLNHHGTAKFKVIKLEDGFDESFFTGGQREFDFESDQAFPME